MEGSHQPAKAQDVRLTVRRNPNQLLVGYGDSSHEEKATLPFNSEDALVRYGLIPPNRMKELDLGSVSAIFRYNPLGRSDTDFTVWYRLCDHPASSITRQGDNWFVKIFVRWYDSSETCLTWAGSEAHLYTETMMCWKPIIIDVPCIRREVGICASKSWHVRIMRARSWAWDFTAKLSKLPARRMLGD